MQLYKYLFNIFYQQDTVEDSGGLLSLRFQDASKIIGRIKWSTKCEGLHENSRALLEELALETGMKIMDKK